MIEVNQGVNSRGQTFGYDHSRRNYITWDLVNGKVIVVLVEHDSEEKRHGSLAATRLDACRIAARETKAENSTLRRSIINQRV